jgi:hypothetical protein
MKGVPDFPHPHSQRIELNFSHVEMGFLTQQVVVVLVTFGPPQVKGTCELDVPLCKGYTDTSNFFSLYFPRKHYWWVSYPPYSYFAVSSFR